MFARLVGMLSVVGLVPAVSFAQGVELKVASSFPRNSIWETGFFMFVDRVNERGKGKIKLNYVGGPEAIPAFQLFDAVRSDTCTPSPNDFLFSSSG